MCIQIPYHHCIVAHTRTSLLRTLNSNINSEWLLPETRALFEQQMKRQQAAAGKYCLVFRVQKANFFLEIWSLISIVLFLTMLHNINVNMKIYG